MANKKRQRVLCLIRCGETTWDQDDRLHGQTDLPLSNAGRAALAGLADETSAGGVSTVYHSSDDAASDTAQIFASAWHVRQKVVEDLADPDLGLLEGLTQNDLAERYRKRARTWTEDPLALIPPEGESVADARIRVFGAVARTIRRSRAQECAFVLHDISLGLLRCFLANRPSGEMWSLLEDRPPVERYLVTEHLAERLMLIEPAVT
ncbi:MAG: histidine phosphatase family protein [Planctomycetota bacterium]